MSEDFHLQLGLSESAAACNLTSWDRWIARLEKLCRHDLDGDKDVDGYSLDCCLDMWRAGKRPIDALATIRWRQHGLHKSH